MEERVLAQTRIRVVVAQMRMTKGQRTRDLHLHSSATREKMDGIPIKEVLQHKGPSNKRMFLVRWNDDSETWVKAKDLSVFARQEYYAKQNVRGKRTNRRSKN